MLLKKKRKKKEETKSGISKLKVGSFPLLLIQNKSLQLFIGCHQGALTMGDFSNKVLTVNC